MSRSAVIEDIYPLSPLQSGLLFHTLLEPDSEVYFEQLTCELHGTLNEAAFADAWRLLVARHAILRTAFVWKGQREPVQVVHRTLELPWRKEDWRELDSGAREAKLAAFLTEDRRRHFEPNRAPLMRLATVRLTDNVWQLVCSHHHLLLDGWSFPLLLREFSEAYDSFCASRTPVLRPARPYSSYLAWLRQLDAKRAEVFWREELRGFTAPTPLSVARPGRRGGDYATEEVFLSQEETQRLRSASREMRVTLNTLLQGAYAVLLNRYSGVDEVVFGISVAGRPADLPGVETIVGLFTNTLPFRASVRAEAEVAGWLRGLHERQLALQEFEYSALSDIQRWSEVPPGQPLFESLLAFENYPVDAAFSQRLGGLEARAVHFVERNNYPLTVVVLPGERLGIKVSFDTARFDRDAVKRLLGHLRCALDALARPVAKLGEITIVGPAEHAALLGTPVVPGSPDLRNGSLHAWFARQAKSTPSAVAVTAASGLLTYEQLDRAANTVAWRLRELGVGRGSLVGLFVERDAPQIVGLLGILKAGGAYVPLDPLFPDERLAFMVADSRAPVVVTQRSLAGRLGATTVTLELDGVSASSPAERDHPPDRDGSPGDPAYVIYTSGSTGVPKGCVITHRNVLRLFTATEEWFGFGPADVWTFFHSAAFDFSVWEIWGALLYGGRVVVVPYLTSRDPAAFCELLIRERVTILNQTPSAFRQLMQAEERQPDSRALALRLVIFGGEALELFSLRPWFNRHGDEYPRLVNMYGITETTVHVTYRPLRQADAAEDRGSLIGVPIPDLRLLVLDARGHLAPIGVPGELYVAGAGLARGYLERPELTAERFVPDPFGIAPDGRLYRTGDFARRLSDGDTEYLGRIDDQVKIRGFRIELGEIERALASHPAVRSAVVLARESTSGEKRLVAYAVPLGGVRPSVDVLRAYLRKRLVEYMVPSAFVWLDTLPVTPNGKVDRRALPAPEGRLSDTSAEYVAPRNDNEAVLAAIWEEVLGLDRVGVRDNYFSLGGDSIRSIRICTQAKERGLDVSLQDLFEKQTIESVLATPARSRIDSTLPGQVLEPFSLIGKETRAQLPADVEDAYPLTRLQAGMLFHSYSNSGGATTYQDLFSHHLRGPLNAAALQEAVESMVRRHAVLRTSFDVGAVPEPLQRVHAQAILPVEWTDISNRTPAEQEQAIDEWLAAQQEFDWTKPPLLRFHVHRRGGEEFQFSIAIHHAILDGWSLASLVAELFHDYLRRLGLDNHSQATTPAPMFRDFVALERSALVDDASRKFWVDTLAGAPILSLPRRERVSGGAKTGHTHLPVDVPTDVANGLTGLAERLRVPLKTLLLAAYVRVLSLVGGQEDVVTGLVTNCRPEVPEGERVAGLFLNTLPLRVRLPHGAWTDLVRTVFKEETTLLPHRRLPLAEIQKRLGGAPLFETDFNFVHFHVYDSLRGLHAIEVIATRAREETNFAITANFGIETSTGRLGGRISCDLDALDARVAAALPGLYGAALEAMVAMPEAPWSASPLIAPADRKLVLQTWNDTEKEFAGPELLHRLFEVQAECTPGAVAVVDDTCALTYAELDQRTNQLARWLRRQGVGPEVLVGVALERSTDLVVALLGVLKAGAGYLPIDPGYPGERIAWMIGDSGVRFVLAGTKLPANKSAGVLHWPELQREVMREAIDGLDVPVYPENPAYVIYTSGSTGRPKGVVVPHCAIVNHMRWMQSSFPLSSDDAVLQKTPISFDAAVWEFFAPLLAGARLVMARQDGHQDPDYLAEAVRTHRVTTLQLVPSMLDFFIEAAAKQEVASLRRLFSGGEVLRPETSNRFHSHLSATLINLYGPTETAIDATFWVCQGDGEVPIGCPVANVQAYILDPQLQPVPPGCLGELYLGGAALSRGYFNRPELTAERFLPDPFSVRPGARLYRTGDLARHRSDGAILYAGRVDDQVKIRGHRVEPGEIEAVLGTCPAVERAVVVAQLDHCDQPRLVAYVVRRPPATVDATSILTFLRGLLPPALVPAAVMFLDRLPLSPNGKLDRRALPGPDFAAAEPASRRREPPATPLEKQLADIWRSVLGVNEVGIHDNFFELGGDSIQSLRLVSFAGRAGWKIRPKQVFDHPTVAGLARVAQRIDSPPEFTAVTFNREDIPLSPIQCEFFALEAPNPHHWNQAVLVKTRVGLPREVLEHAWQEVVRRHAAFRLRFARIESGWRQWLAPEAGAVSPPFVVVNLAEVAPEEQPKELARRCAEAQAVLDIVRGPVACALFFDYGPRSHGRLLLVAHHLCVDVVSWRILLEELTQGCAGGGFDTPVKMPPEELSFPTWAARLPAIAASAETQAEAAYWIGVAGDRVAPLPLDFADGRTHNLEMATDSISWVLGATETAQLLREVPARCRCSVEEVLLAALHGALQEWTGHRETIVHLEGHGREEVLADADLAGAVGWFTTIFPLRLDSQPGDDACARLRHVKEKLRLVPRRGLGYGLLRHCGDDPKTAAALCAGARAEVSFNYLGQIDFAPDDEAPFQAAPESAGQERAPDSPRSHLLDIIAVITGGCLRVQWLYCKQAHQRETINRAACQFGAELFTLLELASHGGAQAVIPLDFELAQLGQSELARVCARKGDLEDIYPLTPLQEGMLVHTLHGGESGVYVQQIAVELNGALDLEALKRAWRDVAQRHAALRLEFIWDDVPAPRQIVRREVPVELSALDWSDFASGEQVRRWRDWLDADRSRAFDLEKAPLWRVIVLRLGSERWRLVWSHHHLLLDGWSLPIVFRDLLSAYALALGSSEGRTEPSPSYRSYLEWFVRREARADESFWRDYLAGYASPPALGIGPVPRGARAESPNQGSVHFQLSPQATASLREFARRQQVALGTCVHAAWAFVLSRWLGTDEPVFGLVVGGRPFEVPDAESMVGLFINTLPLRVPVRRAEQVRTWLCGLQEQIAALRQFEQCRLVDIHGWSEVPRGRPLFESVLIFENYPVDSALGAPVAGLEFGAVESFERTNFPLNLYVLPGERLTLRIDYAESRFEDESVAALIDEVAWLLECLPGSADQRLGTLALLRPEATRKLTAVSRETLRASWDCEPVHARISTRAASIPEVTAVTGSGHALSYGELEARSNQLARHLRGLGAGPGQLVGVCLERSPALVVALLGVLKSGAAYVPVDPAFPPERLAMMREDSGFRIAVIDGPSAASLFPPSVTCVRIDAGGVAIRVESDRTAAVVPQTRNYGAPAARPSEGEGGRSRERLDRGPRPVENRSTTPAELAYVIFTSGSTGRPKGVQVTHGGLANFLAHFARLPGLAPDDVLLAVTTLSFDIAGLELFLPLVCGARVAIATRETAADARRLAKEIEVTRATVMQATPATWRLLITDNWRPSRPFQAWCGGEALPTDLAAELLERGCTVWNFYGPTETTIWSTTQQVAVPADATVIGRPISRTTAYVLDAELNLMPLGAVGELYLGGIGLARGYLGQPGMTAERFVPDPFGESGGRLYATGDLARLRLDGVIEFLGRRDQQVKIRGYRIELGEIEAALRGYPAVRDAAVAAREDTAGEKRLVAYVVGDTVNLGSLAEHLRTRLPEYMLPKVFVPLPELPLTPNGKLDRKRLPAPEPVKIAGADYVAPRNALEQVLADLWRELLGAERIGAREHFFELGGHSLLAAQALARIRKIFEVDLPLRTFFQTGTPENVAAVLTAHERVPGRLLRIATVLLKVRSMSPAERLRVRAGERSA